jgi:CBS domain-containing protein
MLAPAKYALQKEDNMMKASDVMVTHVITVGPELDVKAVANTLAANGISAVPVIDMARVPLSCSVIGA